MSLLKQTVMRSTPTRKTVMMTVIGLVEIIVVMVVSMMMIVIMMMLIGLVVEVEAMMTIMVACSGSRDDNGHDGEN